jgi:hypothetical protein
VVLKATSKRKRRQFKPDSKVHESLCRQIDTLKQPPGAKEAKQLGKRVHA